MFWVAGWTGGRPDRAKAACWPFDFYPTHHFAILPFCDGVASDPTKPVFEVWPLLPTKFMIVHFAVALSICSRTHRNNYVQLYSYSVR